MEAVMMSQSIGIKQALFRAIRLASALGLLIGVSVPLSGCGAGLPDGLKAVSDRQFLAGSPLASAADVAQLLVSSYISDLQEYPPSDGKVTFFSPFTGIVGGDGPWDGVREEKTAILPLPVAVAYGNWGTNDAQFVQIESLPADMSAAKFEDAKSVVFITYWAGDYGVSCYLIIGTSEDPIAVELYRTLSVPADDLAALLMQLASQTPTQFDPSLIAQNLGYADIGVMARLWPPTSGSPTVGTFDAWDVKAVVFTETTDVYVDPPLDTYFAADNIRVEVPVRSLMYNTNNPVALFVYQSDVGAAGTYSGSGTVGISSAYRIIAISVVTDQVIGIADITLLAPQEQVQGGPAQTNATGRSIFQNLFDGYTFTLNPGVLVAQ